MPESTPFDALASTYDADFTTSPIARELRGRVQTRLAALFPAGMHVLELGCGTGEDALWLARHGVRVTATDSSPAMLERARVKTANEPLVSVTVLDLSMLPSGFEGPYDGVFSDFGPLNCLPGWHDLARWLAIRLRPGAKAAFAIMSRHCLWEIGWHSLHGDLRTARRRLGGSSTFQPTGESSSMTVYYPSIRTFEAAFAPWFQRTRVNALGLLLPPTDVYPVIERRPRLLRGLMTLDRGFGQYGVFANYADHFWIELVRTDAPA